MPGFPARRPEPASRYLVALLWLLMMISSAPAVALKKMLAGSGLVFNLINARTVVVDVPHTNTGWC